MSDIPPPPAAPPPPPPPPPPPDMGGAPGGEPGNVDVGQAIGYGWKKFTDNVGSWIVLTLIPFAAQLVISILRFAIDNVFLGVIFSVIAFLVGQILVYGLNRAALLTTEGHKVSVGEAWSDTSQFGNYVVAAILQGLLIAVGFVLCILPGIALLFLTIFTPYFVIDQKMTPVNAIKASISVVSKHIGKLILFLIVAFLVYIAGAVVCFVGLLVSIPVVLIATAFVYKRITAQPVAAV